MDRSKVAIIIPAFNEENTISNVVRASTKFGTAIVIDDGSTDKSVTILNDIDDKCITLYTTKNKGVSHARNYGISKANTDLIAFLDADDLWEPNHLENLHTLYTNFPNCGLYATNYHKQFFYGKKIKTHFNGVSKDHFGIIDDYFLASTFLVFSFTSTRARLEI